MFPITTVPDVRLGPVTAVGSIRGILPFTSFLSTEHNAIQVRALPEALFLQKSKLQRHLRNIGLCCYCSVSGSTYILESRAAFNPSTPAPVNAPVLYV